MLMILTEYQTFWVSQTLIIEIEDFKKEGKYGL